MSGGWGPWLRTYAVGVPLGLALLPAAVRLSVAAGLPVPGFGEAAPSPAAAFGVTALFLFAVGPTAVLLAARIIRR